MHSTVASKSLTWREFVAASKKKGTGPLYTRYVNRNLAIPLTFAFWKLGFSPNVISVISSLVTHAALALLIWREPTVSICVAAYVLLALGFVIDCCDGQLARVSGRTSKLGEWLDHSFDAIKSITVSLVFGFVLIRQAIAHDLPLSLAFLGTFLNVLSQPTHFFVINLKGMLLGKDQANSVSVQSVGLRSWLVRSMTYIADYGLYIMIAMLLPWPKQFMMVFVAYGAFYFLFFSLYFARVIWRAR